MQALGGEERGGGEHGQPEPHRPASYAATWLFVVWFLVAPPPVGGSAWSVLDGFDGEAGLIACLNALGEGREVGWQCVDGDRFEQEVAD